MPEENVNREELSSRPSGELMEDVVSRSEQALEFAARASEEMHELERRAQEALNWRKQLSRHPWVPLGLAIGVAIVGYLAWHSRD